jgi:phosphonate transport system substrate-binding protein
MARLDAEEVELAWLPPLLAFQAMKHAKALPLLAPVRGGTMSFFAALFVPDGAPLESVIDLRGHRVAWVDRASASGYAVVRAALRASGADLTRLFGRETFEGSHRAVVHAVLGGTADVGATYVHRGADGRLLQSGWGDAKARPIFEHGPIPADVLSVAPRVADVIVKAILKAVLVSRDADLMRATREMFEAERLEPVGREHLASLEPLFAHLEE